MATKKSTLQYLMLIGAIALAVLFLARQSRLGNPDPREHPQPMEDLVPLQVQDCLLSGSSKRIDFTQVYKDSPKMEPMAFSTSYWEQSANALSNLMDLQCWAKTVNINKVLQPSIDLYDKSVFHFSPWGSGKLLEFEDLFDVGNWNNLSSHYNFAQLVSLDYFLKHATRDIIFVGIKYDYSWFKCPKLKDIKSYKFLTSKGFKFHESVCVDLKNGPHVISAKTFRDQVFKSTGPNVSLMFGTWAGIRKTYRLALNGTCTASSFGRLMGVGIDKNPETTIKIKENLSAPLAVNNHISSLVDCFLSQYMSGEKYIAIMMRTEKLHRTNKTIFTVPPEHNFCAQAIVSDWKEMADKNNITKTLVLSDIGNHGSAGWYSDQALTFSKYIQKTVGTQHTVDKINSVFEKWTKSTDSVQIAVLHQQLVARASCAILVGGGSFHTLTLNLHLHNHKGEECVAFRGWSCSKGYVSWVSGQKQV